jgi:hypothetical protein
MNADERPEFKLPMMGERILAALATQYEGAKDDVLHAIVVNSRVVWDEGVSYDNYNAAYEHDLRLLVPKAVFARTRGRLEVIQDQLKKDLDSLAHCRGELVQRLTVELDENTIEGWRQDSGLLVRPDTVSSAPTAGDLKRIWTPGFLRVFISHVAVNKDTAMSLKLGMSYYGLSGFVAHCDIEPTRKWLDEIERALQSMHAMVLLLTADFHGSKWTDQETGMALGRGVPVVPVRIDIDPYGFVGKLQAVSGKGKIPKELARELLDVLLKNPVVRDDLTVALVTKFERSWDFDQANELIKILSGFKTLPPSLIERLEKAPERNDSVAKAFTVQRMLPALLKRLKGKRGERRETAK